MVDLFTVIELRSVSPSGTDITLYVSQAGGHRTVVATNRFFADRSSYGAITVAADTAAGSVQAPGTLSIRLQNADGFYDAYLPGGASEQYWSGATVTVYSGGTAGDNVSTMTREFVGYVTPGSLTREAGSFEIGFTVQDKRARDNQPIATQTWDDHAQYNATNAEPSIDGVTIPVILGNWTSGGTRTEKLPTVRLNISGATYTYGYCYHTTSTVTVFHRIGRSSQWTDVTANCTVTATTGYFTANTAAISGFDANQSEFAVTCVGRQDVLTDDNPVRLIQVILDTWGNVTPASDIYNAVDEADNNIRGSFENTYNLLGAASPDYTARAYIDSADTRVLEVVGRIAFESGLIVGHDGGKYRCYPTLPIAASRSLTVGAWSIVGGQIGSEFDPDATFSDVARIRYHPDPSANWNPTAFYDTSVSVSSGPIADARTAYGSPDAVYTDTWLHVYGSGVATAIQRALFWRIGRSEIVGADVIGEPGNGAWTHSLGADTMFASGRYDGVDVRILKITKRPRDGSVGFVGLALHGLLTAGVWADSSGNDAAGNPVTGSKWANASGEDGSGNAVTSMWV